MEQQNLFEARYDSRFLDKFLGNMAKDPVIAITELLANTFDAGATEIHISWPVNKELNNPIFKIEDNGTGLTLEEFKNIWSKLNYDRIKNQGDSISIFGINGDLIEKEMCLVKMVRDASLHSVLMISMMLYLQKMEKLSVQE